MELAIVLTLFFPLSINKYYNRFSNKCHALIERNCWASIVEKVFRFDTKFCMRFVSSKPIRWMEILNNLTINFFFYKIFVHNKIRDDEIRKIKKIVKLVSNVLWHRMITRFISWMCQYWSSVHRVSFLPFCVLFRSKCSYYYLYSKSNYKTADSVRMIH